MGQSALDWYGDEPAWLATVFAQSKQINDGFVSKLREAASSVLLVECIDSVPAELNLTWQRLSLGSFAFDVAPSPPSRPGSTTEETYSNFRNPLFLSSTVVLVGLPSEAALEAAARLEPLALMVAGRSTIFFFPPVFVELILSPSRSGRQEERKARSARGRSYCTQQR